MSSQTLFSLFSGFFSQFLHQTFKRRLGYDVTELSPIVVHQADTFYDHIIGLPLLVFGSQLVHDRDLSVLLRYDPYLYLRIVPVNSFSYVTHLFTGLSLHLVDVRSLKQLPEKVNKLLFFLIASLRPVSSKRPAGHLLPVAQFIHRFSNPLPPLRFFGWVFEVRIADHREDFVRRFFDLF